MSYAEEAAEYYEKQKTINITPYITDDEIARIISFAGEVPEKKLIKIFKVGFLIGKNWNGHIN